MTSGQSFVYELFVRGEALDWLCVSTDTTQLFSATLIIYGTRGPIMMVGVKVWFQNWVSLVFLIYNINKFIFSILLLNYVMIAFNCELEEPLVNWKRQFHAQIIAVMSLLLKRIFVYANYNYIYIIIIKVYCQKPKSFRHISLILMILYFLITYTFSCW